jgi:hypothetical protein
VLTRSPFARARAAGLGLLLALAGGCGLADYEALTREAQEREQRFREQGKYLGDPIEVPTRKEKDVETRLADVFFRPPRGIPSRADDKPRGGLLYRYAPRQPYGDFPVVEMAFASGDKEFTANVLRNYQAADQATRKTRQFQPPGRPALTFDVREFDDAQYSYSANFWQGGRTQVAIVLFLTRGRRESARKVMDLSLESFAADGATTTARLEFARKAPWRLKAS